MCYLGASHLMGNLCLFSLFVFWRWIPLDFLQFACRFLNLLDLLGLVTSHLLGDVCFRCVVPFRVAS